MLTLLPGLKGLRTWTKGALDRRPLVRIPVPVSNYLPTVKNPATGSPEGSMPASIDIVAGGPGSGCHGPNCGPPSKGHVFKLPDPPSMTVVKSWPTDRAWVKHEHWKKQAYGAVVVNRDGQFLLREPAGHFDGYTWTFP